MDNKPVSPATQMLLLKVNLMALSHITWHFNAKWELMRAIERNAEDGQIMLVESGRDCDGVQYDGVLHGPIAAHWWAVRKLEEKIAKWADGPFYLRVIKPSEAAQVELWSRDLTMEASRMGIRGACIRNQRGRTMTTQYRVDRVIQPVVPCGMNSILYYGTDAAEAAKVFEEAQPGISPWGTPNDAYGVILSVWDDNKRNYVIKRRKGLGQ